MKLKETLEYFLNTYPVDSTRNTYAKFLCKFVDSIGPDRPLELIREEDLNAYIYEMSYRTAKYEGHPLRPVENERLSSMTVYKNVKMIRPARV